MSPNDETEIGSQFRQRERGAVRALPLTDSAPHTKGQHAHEGGIDTNHASIRASPECVRIAPQCSTTDRLETSQHTHTHHNRHTLTSATEAAVSANHQTDRQTDRQTDTDTHTHHTHTQTGTGGRVLESVADHGCHDDRERERKRAATRSKEARSNAHQLATFDHHVITITRLAARGGHAS